MIDDDDWMNPRRSIGWSMPPPKETWLIQRERVINCTWMGDGPPREWATWMSYDTRKERDAELRRLRETTSWHLRPAYQPLHGRMQIEDEEIDLLNRLAKVRAKAETRIVDKLESLKK